MAETTYVLGLSKESMIRRVREGSGLVTSCLAQKISKKREINVRRGKYLHRFHDGALSEIHIDDVRLPPIWSKSCSDVGGGDAWESGNLTVGTMMAQFL